MNKRNILTFIISILFIIMVFFTFYIGKPASYNKEFINSFNFEYIYIFPIIFLSIVFYIILKTILKLVSKINIYESKKIINSKIIFIISFITIFLSGLLFLLTYYPGTGMVDTAQILSNPILFSNQYPLIYSLISSFIFNTMFKITNSSNFSYFILSLLQLIFMTSIISYVIYWMHKKFKSNIISIITIIYFNIFTIFSNLNSAHLRDSIFSVLILLLITIIYEIIESNLNYLDSDKNRFKLMFVSMCMIFSRNNAFIILLVLIILLVIKYKRHYKYFTVLFLFILVLCNLKIFLPKKYHNKGFYQESISVPIQQISYVIKYKNIDDNDKKFLDNIIYTDTIRELYDPYMVDKIKWNHMFNSYYLNNHRQEFNNIWFKYLKRYPKEYLKAYILNTYSLWSINEYNSWESSFFIIDSGYRTLYNQRILPNDIYLLLDFIYKKTTKFINNGSLFWIYVFLFLLAIYKNKKKYLIIFIPFICLWINHMVASPLSSALRYMSPLAYALPFIVGIVFYKEKDKAL